jgi:Ca2+-transporting ATPase
MILLTIFINAVPDGLPLTVTFSLALSMKTMIEDNNFVRKLAACETMGSATTICSDKTGTLTQNQMTVVRFLMIDTVHEDEEVPNWNEETKKIFFESISVNTTASIIPGVENDDTPKFVGMSSECALLKMAFKNGLNFQEIRAKFPVVLLHDFNSTRKRMSTIVKYQNSYRIYSKGAPDYLLPMCSHYLTEEGEICEFDNDIRNSVIDHVIEFADNALRTLLIAYRDLDSSEYHHEWEEPDNVEKNLIMIGICGILDPLRPEVKKSIQDCKRAGVMVRMVTGDYINTAKAIAKSVESMMTTE